MHTTHAVCLLLRDDSDRILTISRPHDRDDVGLIGGGVEPEDAGADEESTLRNAIIREAREEAGLVLSAEHLRAVFIAQARTRIAVTFVYDAEAGAPILGENEEGFVSWSQPDALLDGSFGDYNRALFSAVRDTPRREVLMPDTTEPTGLDESSEFHAEELIELEDDDGTCRVFALLAVVEIDGQNFAMLSPHASMTSEDDEEPLEIALFAYEEDAEGATYSDIEDEALFARVQEYCIALLRDEA